MSRDFVLRQLMDRQLKCSIAKDNGRAEEFIRKRVYPDKSRCYECGEVGHLSYQCSKNSLGEREPPKKNRKSRKKDLKPPDQASADDEDDREASEGEDPALDSLGAAIRYEVMRKCKTWPSPHFLIVCSENNWKYSANPLISRLQNDFSIKIVI